MTCIRSIPPAILALTLLPGLLMSCSSSFESIDQQVEAIMAKTNQRMGGDFSTPQMTGWDLDAAEQAYNAQYNPTNEFIPTVNPAAADLEFVPSPERDTDEIIAKLDEYNVQMDSGMKLDLQGALAYAIEHSREYRFEEEEFVLASLRLLIERHQWGPRFFNDFSAQVNGAADNGLYDTSLSLVNEFRLTQRLPYGGEVSVTALASATEDLHQRVVGENVQSADIILAADIPLLRGSGTVARESRIQAERDMVYAARSFERFRREFLENIAADFLNLVFQQRSVKNREINVANLELVESRERARVEAGRIDPFQASRAENATVSAKDSLNSARESFRLGVDRFKVRLGMPVTESLEIVDSRLGLPLPLTNLEDAVRVAMMYRLDLQTERDRYADVKRTLDNARNDLLPDFDLDASVSMPTNPDDNRGGLSFRGDELDFSAGVTYGLPLDREIERLAVRQAQIALERARRDYDETRDDIASSVRSAVRGIDSDLLSVQIQTRGVEIAQQGVDVIAAAPERFDTIDQTDAAENLLTSQDDLDRANVDLQLSILRYLLETGQLRTNNQGFIQPLTGMELTHSDPEPESPADADPNTPPDG